jgi:hypothetical protein
MLYLVHSHYRLVNEMVLVHEQLHHRRDLQESYCWNLILKFIKL